MLPLPVQKLITDTEADQAGDQQKTYTQPHRCGPYEIGKCQKKHNQTALNVLDRRSSSTTNSSIQPAKAASATVSWTSTAPTDGDW